LVLALESNIWSNDKKLQQDQKETIVLSTEDLIKKINLIKIKD
jgi:hypothetical protein